MPTEEFIRRIRATLTGETSLEELGRWLDALTASDPDSAVRLSAELEAAYARNEVRYDLYLLLKDRLMPRTLPPRGSRQPTGPAVTRLRTAARAPTDATMLRSPTNPAVRTTGARSTSPTQASVGFEDASEWTLAVARTLESGIVIKNRFVLEHNVGAGGMGTVFKARDIRKEEAQDRNPYVAIKFLNDEFRQHPEALKALQRETRRAQTLAHPNIVTVYDFDREGTLIYMTMEFLEGEPLDEDIRRHPQGLPFAESWPIIEGAGRALAYAHERGIVHADFKPGNVFVASDHRVKVLDFGIARAVQRHGESPAEGTKFDAGVLGALTPAYASPEMLLDQEPDPRDDVFALACVAYEVMTGRHPFGGLTALKAAHQGLRVKRPKSLKRTQHRAIEHALAFKREARTPSVAAFLEEFAPELGVQRRSARRTAAWVVAATLATAAVAAGIWWQTRPDPDEQLIRYVLAEAAKSPMPEDARDPEILEILLEQGRDYLTIAANDFNPSMLSQGVSSAYGAFKNVLRMDPNNMDAAHGIVEVVHLYEAEINRAMEAGDYKRAAELIGYAQDIAPDRTSLDAMAKRVAEKTGATG
jgi:serine/threonine protein kinase